MRFEFMGPGSASTGFDAEPREQFQNGHTFAPAQEPPPQKLNSDSHDALFTEPPSLMDAYTRLNRDHLKQQHRLGNGLSTPTPQHENARLVQQNGFAHLDASTNNNGIMTPEAPDLDATNGVGMASMLERMHNVTDRSQVPQKRPRNASVSSVNDREKKKVQTFGNGQNGGILSDYVKDKQEEGRQSASMNGAAFGSVDLTGDTQGRPAMNGASFGSVDLTENTQERMPAMNGAAFGSVDLTEDTDVDMNAVQDPSQEEVCFGRLDGAEVRAHLVPQPKPGTVSMDPNFWPAVKVVLRRRVEHRGTGNRCVEVIDGARNTIGCVDANTCLGLVPLLDTDWMGIRAVARIMTRPKRFGEPQPGQECSTRYSLDVSLYGRAGIAKQVGNHLSNKGLRLQSPFMLERGKKLVNPHAGLPQGVARNGIRSLGYTHVAPAKSAEEVKNDIMGVFDKIQQADTMEETEAVLPITTPLLQHQKQGLTFMIEREKVRSWTKEEDQVNSMWKVNIDASGRKTYSNVVTGQELPTEPPQTQGGILADMMGLGKTLSILSLCASTLKTDAVEWARTSPREDEDYPGHINSRATLLISPLSVIANWEEQIQQHVQPGGLKYHIYHGPGRLTDLRELANHDLVITTYGTAASVRSSKKSSNPLEKINWFRIVLDEAHIIREQKTAQCQAICRLPAQRRWAVTGTPVQNRLDDLGALLKFLRLAPFDDRAAFGRYILQPCKNANPEILPKLRILVDSITLRRQKDRIGLPERIDKKIELNFTADEQRVYDIFAENAQNSVKMLTHDSKHMMRGNSYAYILQAILRLRLICAHGKDLLGEKDMELLAGRTANEAISLDDDDDDEQVLTPAIAYRMYNMARMTNDNCLSCNKQIGKSDTPDSDSDSKEEAPIGFMTPCYHILCTECYKDYNKTMISRSADAKTASCTICSANTRLGAFPLILSEADEAQERAEQTSRAGKQVGANYTGPHTKTHYLINQLLNNQLQSQSDSSQPPIKSVVFSGWTSHLNLIQYALENAGIKYTRLDGRMSRSQRSRALDKFRDDPSVVVILISISAGGLGLNLTHANKVYVMEPQYNPAAEEQAVDRVYRLGQKRVVEVHKLIMKDSFEEKMLALQEKKKKLAKMSMDGERGKKGVAREDLMKQRLEELRDLFR